MEESLQSFDFSRSSIWPDYAEGMPDPVFMLLTQSAQFIQNSAHIRLTIIQDISVVIWT